MRLTSPNNEERKLLPDQQDRHSTLQFRRIRQDTASPSLSESTPPEEYIYTETVKSIGNNEFIEEKRLLKRASWTPADSQDNGLPPSGKRAEGEQLNTTRHSHRVRLRPKTARYYQPQVQQQVPALVRPVSYTERYNRHLIDYQQHKPVQPALNRHRSFTHQRHDLSPSPSTSSMDTLVQITSRASPSLDNSDFISDTSTASSVTTTNTITSMCSNIPSVRFSHRPSSTSDSICSSPTRPFLSEYPHTQPGQIDYKVLTPVSNTNIVSIASPISSSPSSSSRSTSTAAVACPKGHEQLSTSSLSSFPSPMRSSLNQYAKFTSQTPTADTSRDDISPATTTRSLMTMSMSPNRHHNQTRSVKAIIASAQISPSTDVTITPHNGDGLKQHKQGDQTESSVVGSNGCLKSPSNAKSNSSRVKKSVHFDWHLPPEEIRSPPPVKASRSNYRPTSTMVTIASSSSLFNENGNGDNDEQKKRDDEWRDVGTERENERIETARRTITTNPLTNNHHHRSTILRSLSLSTSPPPPAQPLSNEESNDSRRYREEKKENVDDSNCTTSRRVTTAAVAAAATHLQRTATTSPVTFNDGSNNNVSQKNESNSTNNSSTILLKRPPSIDKHMPLNSLMVKAPSLSTIVNPPNPPTSSTAKKLISHGFFSLIGRSNSNNNKSPSTTTTTTSEENKQLRRTSSTQLRAQQRKAKQQTTETNGNQRLSADVESLLPLSSINTNHAEISLEEKLVSDKVATHRESERQSAMSLVSTTTDRKTTSTISASNIDLSLSATLNDSAMPVPSNSTTIKADGGDSLDNGFLFQPVLDPKCDYVLHQHHHASSEKEPFFLSPSNATESPMTQTSTLIISTPPQYHYYLYPPINNTNTLSSSSSSASSISSTSKKAPKIIATSNRTISNVSINSVSTNSSSSYPSYESHTHDHDYQHSSSQLPLHAEDETLSSSTNSIVVNQKIRQKKVVQSALIDWKMKTSAESATSDSSSRTKPVILSDSVQAFWPPPPSPSTLDKDPGQKATVLTTEQTKQSESIAISNPLPSSTSNQNSINPPPLDILSSNDETGSYSEQHTFSLRNASDTSLEDTQASYVERLRQKSRSIPMNGNVHSHEMYTHLRRSVSKDTLNDSHRRSNTHLHTTDFATTSEKTLRPKSAGHQLESVSIHGHVPEPAGQQIGNDFRSKRDFFENRIYTERTLSKSPSASPPTSSVSTTVKPKVYTLYPMHSPTMNNNNPNHGLLQATTVNHNNNHQAHYVTRRSWNDLLSQSSPPTSPSVMLNSPGNQAVLPPPSANPLHRKPVRIVKAVQRSPPSNGEVPQQSNRPLSSSKTYSLAKPGLFSASPINSLPKLPNKSSNAIRRFQSRDETDLQCNLKEFAARYPNNHSFNELARLTLSDEHHLSTDYTRALFPIPDRLRRLRSRQSSGGESSSSFDYISRTVSNEKGIDDDHSLRQAEDLISNLKKHLDMLKDNQRMINEEITENQTLGSKLLNHIECHAEPNEIEKFKLHINEIDTITSILLKLSSRLAKVENDLSTLAENNESNKASLIERREQAQEKHDEAKALKDGIDRRSRLVTSILRKYFSAEQFDDYEHFIRMKSALLMDGKDIEEHLSLVQKQIQLLQTISAWLATPVHKEPRYSSSIADFQSLNTSNHADNLQTNAYKTISSTA